MASRQPRPRAIDRIDPLIGVWRTSGYVLDDEGQPASEITGTDAYEWLAGRWFVVHHVDVSLAGQPVVAIEMIGWDPRREAFLASLV
jgi:hypothetical protein